VTYVVVEACIKCKYMDCAEVCPVDCFHEGREMLVIHPDRCIDCGLCAPKCPADAIEPGTAPGLKKWLKLNRDNSRTWPGVKRRGSDPVLPPWVIQRRRAWSPKHGASRATLAFHPGEVDTDLSWRFDPVFRFEAVVKRSFLLAVLAALLAQSATAQEWPARPVKIYIPFGPGSTPDMVGRMIADRLQQKLRQAFIIEDKPGASGNTGTDAVAKAAPDGYTLGISIGGPLAINPLLFGKMPYDPARDIATITMVATQPSVLAVNAQLGVDSVTDLIGLLKKNPGKYNYGSIGNGSLSHLAMEALALASGTAIVHIPYASSPQAMTALVRGDVEIACLPAISVTPQLASGEVKILAVSRRSEATIFTARSQQGNHCLLSERRAGVGDRGRAPGTGLYKHQGLRFIVAWLRKYPRCARQQRDIFQCGATQLALVNTAGPAQQARTRTRRSESQEIICSIRDAKGMRPRPLSSTWSKSTHGLGPLPNRANAAAMSATPKSDPTSPAGRQ
jgi:tripartite-type tricarboxylate transporter receptor subunit TctC/NAD-dependent dihydropyrimidine dehydrogenase PreA subunit